MKPIQPTRWIRYCFILQSPNDSRPVQWPPKGPYWVAGEGDGHMVLVAYLPKDTDLATYWPKASCVNSEESASITYTNWFVRPSWWNGE